MIISVIIPVLREGDKINALLASLQPAAAAVPYETIVVDGDPAGSTIGLIDTPGVITAVAPRGRASQMNAGAAAARGSILLFLHADTLLPPAAFPRIVAALADGRFVGGAFDLAIQNRRRIYRVIEKASSWKHRLTRVPYGDQAIFLRRSYFATSGGYRGIPLLEEVELMRRVKKQGDRITILADPVRTAARRWETDGIIYTIIRNWLIEALFLFGVPARHLQKFYYK